MILVILDFEKDYKENIALELKDWILLLKNWNRGLLLLQGK